ncbi:MAG: acetylglutamate kinase [Dehalococcoidia bacterium]
MANQTSHNTIVVKIGGSTLGENDTTLEDVVTLQKEGYTIVLVHGGGKTVSQWLDVHRIPTRFIQGLRVTDKSSLEVVTAVLAGLVNKELVSNLRAMGAQAVGISGVDGGLIEAGVKDRELGYVGEITNIDLKPLRVLIQEGYIPVVAPLGGQSLNGLPGAEGMLNINADTVAGRLAEALHASRLIFLTDVPGVRDSSGRPLARLSPSIARRLVRSGTISSGMIPKVEACILALSTVPIAQILDGRETHALLEGISDKAKGTRIEG